MVYNFCFRAPAQLFPQQVPVPGPGSNLSVSNVCTGKPRVRQISNERRQVRALYFFLPQTPTCVYVAASSRLTVHCVRVVIIQRC